MAHKEEGSSPRPALYVFSPLSTVTVQRTLLQPLQQVTSFPKWEHHSFLVVQKDLSHFCKSSCNMQGSTHFSKSMLCSSNAPCPQQQVCALGARKGHGLPKEPWIPRGPWVRGWGHRAVLSI